eukprot:TRINITY_DN2313_c0_g1_i1.p1 TRINITY_DN2313_c0_g1~~TRINITY_DN2313_c0_g1_i1.p1  ORF type:complete len:462 (+),score=55.48 TRINITY_DN2313_c0_g1_i1:119-1504(+)
MIPSLQFTLTILTCYVYAKCSPYFSLAHKWLSGLEFCIPPEEKELSLLDVSLRRKGRRVSEGFKKNEIELKVATIEDNTLLKHLFWDEYDKLVLVLVCVVVNFVFAVLCSCFAFERNTVMTAVLLFGIGICFKIMMSVIVNMGLQSFELRLTFIVGILSFGFAFAVLSLPDNIFDFSAELREGFTELGKEAQIFLDSQFQVKMEVPFMAFKLSLCAVASFIAAVLFFPSFRLARSHYELMKFVPNCTIWSTWSCYAPAFILTMWARPAVDRLLLSVTGVPSVQSSLVNSIFEGIRFYFVIFLCVLRLYLLRPYIQAFLYTAVGWTEILLSDPRMKDRGKNIKFKIVGIYSYLCVAAVQILAPTLMLMCMVFLWKLRGTNTEGVIPYCSSVQEEVISKTWKAMSINLGDPPTLFTPQLYGSLFSFLSWWVLMSWFVIAFFALLYEKNQSIFSRREPSTREDE